MSVSKSSVAWVMAPIVLAIAFTAILFCCSPNGMDVSSRSPTPEGASPLQDSNGLCVPENPVVPESPTPVAAHGEDPVSIPQRDEDGFEIVRARPIGTSVASGEPGWTDVYEPTADEMVQLESGAFDQDSCDVADVGTAENDRSPIKALPSRKSWLSEFNKTRRQLIKTHCLCEACGRSAEEAGGHLDMHHVISVERIIHEKLDKKLLTDPRNMIMLCRGTVSNCHFQCGHTVDGRSSWSLSNRHVRRDAALNLAACYPDRTYEDLVAEFQSNASPAVEILKTRKRVPSKTIIAP